uniref:Uncharacterized protein n=1 Tax=Myoviridae sp. ctrnx29 TaxID=2826704 RepID=A0A8S5LY74_9CAUD|nr:MAG TPA: hypothetical protein [Myoviridae sp. ctrnx29]
MTKIPKTSPEKKPATVTTSFPVESTHLHAAKKRRSFPSGRRRFFLPYPLPATPSLRFFYNSFLPKYSFFELIVTDFP